MTHPFHAQIDDAVTLAGPLWRNLDDKRLFMTGGTGFFGRWLLEAMVRAEARFGLKFDITVVTRNIEGFRAKAPHLAATPCIRLHRGDVRSFDFPDGDFDYVLHGAATSAKATFDRAEDPLTKFETAFQGTRRVLDLAVERKAERVLMVGSGSVYGGMAGPVAEDFPGAPLTTDVEAGLGHGKRASEFLCACYADTHGLSLSIARCFSFVGAYLPLGIHYAIGNFIQHALHEDSITVRGDGTPLRSYLFAGDLVVWLMTLLIKGQPRRVYNVGSDRMVALGDLAHMVRDVVAPHKPVHILGKDQGGPRSCYVPDITRARTELGLDVLTSLEDSIRRTAEVARVVKWADG